MFGLDSRRLRHKAVYWLLLVRSRVRTAMWAALSSFPTSTARMDLIPSLGNVKSTDPNLRTRVENFGPLPSAEIQYAFLLKGRCFIEPKYGWVIASPGHLVRNSFAYSDWSEFAGNLLSKPSVLRTAWLAARSRRHYASVISLRTPWDNNYFHFFNEVLGPLRMLDQLDIRPDVPVLISGDLWSRPYFQEALAAGVFGGRAVICQRSDVMISADEVFLLKRRGGDPGDYDYFLDRLPAAPAREGRGRRLFLAR